MKHRSWRIVSVLQTEPTKQTKHKRRGLEPINDWGGEEPYRFCGGTILSEGRGERVGCWNSVL